MEIITYLNVLVLSVLSWFNFYLVCIPAQHKNFKSPNLKKCEMKKILLYALAICGITLIPISLSVKKEEKANTTQINQNQNLENIVNECASNPILLSFIDNPIVVNSTRQPDYAIRVAIKPEYFSKLSTKFDALDVEIKNYATVRIPIKDKEGKKTYLTVTQYFYTPLKTVPKEIKIKVYGVRKDKRRIIYSGTLEMVGIERGIQR